MELKRKIGDKVRIKATNEEGKVCRADNNCYSVSFQDDIVAYTFREAQLCDPAPVKVGDVLVHRDGDEAKVLEVFENTFMRSIWGDFDEPSSVYTFSQIKKQNWKIKGQDSDIITHNGKRYKEIKE